MNESHLRSLILGAEWGTLDGPHLHQESGIPKPLQGGDPHVYSGAFLILLGAGIPEEGFVGGQGLGTVSTPSQSDGAAPSLVAFMG